GEALPRLLESAGRARDHGRARSIVRRSESAGVDMTGLTLVTGGTGKVGARLVQRLRNGGVPVRSAARSKPASDVGGGAHGIENVAFDWYDSSGHDAAL